MHHDRITRAVRERHVCCTRAARTFLFFCFRLPPPSSHLFFYQLAITASVCLSVCLRTWWWLEEPVGMHQSRQLRTVKIRVSDQSYLLPFRTLQTMEREWEPRFSNRKRRCRNLHDFLFLFTCFFFCLSFFVVLLFSWIVFQMELFFFCLVVVCCWILPPWSQRLRGGHFGFLQDSVDGDRMSSRVVFSINSHRKTLDTESV